MNRTMMNTVDTTSEICMPVDFILWKMAFLDQKIYDEETWILSL